MEKSKTVIEWFEQAKVQGYDWADKAIEQTPEENKNHKASSLSDAVYSAFSWLNSKEGEEYWYNIYKQLIEKRK